MNGLPKRKSNCLFRLSFVAFVTAGLGTQALAIETASLFLNGPKVAQGTSPAEPAPKVQAKPVNEQDCQDTAKLYVTISATHEKPQVAAEALIETIYRHETMQRLVMIAAAAGCNMRPFIDEEVRRSKR